MAAIHAKRALALVGTPFRPQGRDPRQGVDCIGLCLIAYRLPHEMARNDYRLRGRHLREIETAILGTFRKLESEFPRPGDLLLLRPAEEQAHLAVLTSQGFVHADARLRRVVETPGRPDWPVAGAYRMRRRDRS